MAVAATWQFGLHGMRLPEKSTNSNMQVTSQSSLLQSTARFGTVQPSTVFLNFI